jgi:hypothetical protein
LGTPVQPTAYNGNSHGVLGRRHAGLEIGHYRLIDAESLGAQWVLGRLVQRRLLIGLLVPRSGIVIAVDGEEVHLRSGSLQIDVDIVLLPAGESNDRMYFLPVVFDQGVELRAELFQQGGEILLVRRGGKLPVDIEAVEETGSLNAWGDVALDKQSMHEEASAARPAGLSGCHPAGRVAGLSPQRDQHFQMGMKLLELLDRAIVSIERRGERLAIHTGNGRILVGVQADRRLRRRAPKSWSHCQRRKSGA